MRRVNQLLLLLSQERGEKCIQNIMPEISSLSKNNPTVITGEFRHYFLQPVYCIIN
jgi:hypothetical protein